MGLIAPAYCTDQQYPFSTLRLQMGSLISAGVINPTDLQVSVSSGLQVQIASGQAYVQQTVETEGSAYAGLYYNMNDAPANPYNTVSAPVRNPRVDTVILRVYDVDEQSLSGSSKAQFEWVEGTESAGATLANLDGLAAVPANSLELAYVLQTVGEGSISPSNILNLAQPALPFGAQAGDFKFTGASSAPGFVVCDGTAYSRRGYARLFGAIGTSWGAGDGSTTFNVPDFRGRTIIGAGSGPGLSARSVGQKGGEETHALTEAENGPHNHGGQTGTGSSTVSAYTSNNPASGTQVTGSQWAFGAVTYTAAVYDGVTTGVVSIPSLSISTDGSGNGHNNMQPYGVANVLIRI